ncbi:MAG: hypothetical protein DRO94_02360 [Candidatus Altiarchaeales archaeon]|nr:MAG: hypothetical protein DRO95_02165 [Candidatus Altiarchaeales archaeon]RLI94658.1 MAG: hypothetical protein DRO94_02360 [Candidatus Altiarchaeales archaeon]HDO82346.1 hypothetical protein [Candidatus Altiarchaeales archaeon]HEX54995.1 hypothetical protein [Candidatus Altiarchaeales archaeon]
MTKKIIFLVFLVMLSCLGSADIDVSLDARLSKSEIKPGESFYLYINITNIDTEDITSQNDIELAIYSDNILIHHDIIHEEIPQNSSKEISISSNKFNVDYDDIWGDDGLLGYKCNTHEIEVRVYGDVSSESSIEELKISGEELFVGIEPSPLTPKDEIMVIVEDKDGNRLDNVNVRLIQLGENDEWDIDDVSRDERTNRDGEAIFTAIIDDFRFRDEPYGKYQINVWDDDYCLLTKTFDIRNRLKIDRITPEDIFAGDEIRVKVVDINNDPVENSLVTVSGPGISGGISRKTDSNGIAKFILTETGTFNIIATKEGYEDSDIITIRIMKKKPIDIKIEPKDAIVGRTVKLVVTSEGELLSNATIEIKNPYGRIDTLIAESGEIEYIPTTPGRYEIKVTKAAYETTMTTFLANNIFNVSVPDVEIGREVRIKVYDQNNKPVENANIVIEGTSISGSTNSDGEFSFTLTTAGEYKIVIKKNGFRDYERDMVLYSSLLLDISPDEIYIGNSSEIRIFDENGNRINATITISGPKEFLKVITKDRYLFKPDHAGVYNITASREFYNSTTSRLVVKPLFVNLELRLNRDLLLVRVTHADKPLENITVEIIMPDNRSEYILTNSDGIASLNVENISYDGEFRAMVVDDNYKSEIVVKRFEKMNIISILIIIIVVLILILISGAIFYLSHKVRRGSIVEKGKSRLGKKRRGLSGV